VALTDINSEDRLVQQTFADHLEKVLGWEGVYAYNAETFGPHGTLGRASEREVVLVRDLRTVIAGMNPDLPAEACEQAVEKLIRIDYARSLIQHNREFYGFIRGGVPVEWRDASGETRHAHAQVIDFRDALRNRFLAVRELKIQGVRVPHYNRRADLVCFVNGLPLVFIELKAVYRNIRAGFDDNLTDYLSEHSIAQAFHHNAFLVVSNGDQARYGSITSKWEHFVEWKRNAENEEARLDAEALLDGMLAKERLLDLVENFILYDDSRAGGDAEDHRAQPSGARRQQRRRIGVAAGGAEAPVPAERAAAPRASATAGVAQGRPAATTLCCAVSRCRRRRRRAAAGEAGASRPGPAGGVLAHAGQRQVLLDGVLRREGATCRARELHLPRDDRPRRPRRPDLAHLHRLRRDRREDPVRRLG
jgi:hypothetical protein